MMKIARADWWLFFVAEAEEILPLSLDQVVESIRELYPCLSKTTAFEIAQQGYKRSDDGEYVPKYDTRMSLQSEKAGYSAENMWSLLNNVTCPTMLVRGEKSPFLSRKDAGKMCKVMVNATCEEIPYATHMPAQENPEAFMKAVSIFLQKLM